MTYSHYKAFAAQYKDSAPLKVKVSIFKKWGSKHYLSKEWKDKEHYYLLPCEIMSFEDSSVKVHYKHKYQNVKSVIVIPYNQIVNFRTWGI